MLPEILVHPHLFGKLCDIFENMKYVTCHKDSAWRVAGMKLLVNV
jgi:hypothetical protein